MPRRKDLRVGLLLGHRWQKLLSQKPFSDMPRRSCVWERKLYFKLNELKHAAWRTENKTANIYSLICMYRNSACTVLQNKNAANHVLVMQIIVLKSQWRCLCFGQSLHQDKPHKISSKRSCIAPLYWKYNLIKHMLVLYPCIILWILLSVLLSANRYSLSDNWGRTIILKNVQYFPKECSRALV